MCDNSECKCTYCKGDNYDRYISDHLRQMMDTMNGYLIDSVNPKDERIDGEEHFYKVVKNFVCGALDELKAIKEKEKELKELKNN